MRLAPVNVPHNRRRRVRDALAAGTLTARCWWAWQSMPRLTPADLCEHMGTPNALRYAAAYARRHQLPFRRTR